MKIELNRTVLNICGVCNLKCKNCLAFIPYYKEQWVMSSEEANKILSKYFEVVDTVNTFTITGGEPLLNKDCATILFEVSAYFSQIKGTIDFVTNATMLFPDDVLSFFEKFKDRTKIVLSDYGCKLSKKRNEIVQQLDERGIKYRISKFTGEDMYFDGWIDFNDHSLKWTTIEERDANAKKCIHSVGKYFVINEGNLFRCSRYYWRKKIGIISGIEGEYVPLLDEQISTARKKELVREMLKKTSSTSCAYCVGFCNGVPRVKPAIQIGEE